MKYTPENVQIIVDTLTQGKRRIEAVDNAGISYQSFMEWLRNHVEFAEAVKKAEEEGRDRYKKKYLNRIQEIAGLELSGAKNTGIILGACQWLLERQFPDEYSATIHNRMTGWVEMGETEADRKKRQERLKTFLTDVFINSVKVDKKEVKEEVKA